jgi:hypothetical protein
MSEPNGSYLWLPPTKKPAAWSKRVSAAWTTLRALPPPVRLGFVLTLIVLAGLLAGCAHNSPASQAAAIPAPPRLSQPLPSETYSGSAAKKLDDWRQRLTATPPM